VSFRKQRTRSGGAAAIGATLLASALLAGCGGMPASQSDFNQVTVGPGDTRTCYTDPCTILYRMPSGQGTYTVRVNNLFGANIAAGSVGNLGGFYRFDSPIRVTVDGLAVEEAVVFISPEY
jgi:hypothetical protein